VRPEPGTTVYREFFHQSPVGTFTFDADGVITEVNARFAHMLGAPPESHLGLDLKGPGIDPAARAMYEAVRAGRQSEYVGPLTSAVSGRRVWISLLGVPLRDASGAFIGGLAVCVTPTEPEAAERHLAHLLLHDAATGLPNRTLLEDRARQALEQARSTGRRLAIVMLSADRFEQIDESLGRTAAEQLLVSLATRLGRCAGDSDTLARTGDNEFVALLTEAGSTAAIISAVECLAGELSTPFAIGDHTIQVAASIGIALYPDDASSVDGLLHGASAALHRSRAHGGGTWEFFHHRMTTEATSRLTLENELRRDLAAGRIVVHYQPLAEAQDGRIVGYEALARWRHPERGLLMPDDFLEVAEQSGLIVPLGGRVLHAACHQTQAWNAGRMRPLRVCVNLSPRQLRDGDLADTIAQALDASGLRPDLLEIEITETSALLLQERAALTLADIRSMGVRVSLDDFGAGYSSLSHLIGLPIDAVKIDGTFVSRLETSPRDAAVVTAIIDLAHSLGLTVVAESVESPGQASFMRARGCDLLQGFLIGEPLPAEERAAELVAGPASRRPALVTGL
jgi:diguanylate cyclase (GGDEF)-like protein/PAS domain S-box-containing protein